jgi:hypothetical protein
LVDADRAVRLRDARRPATGRIVIERPGIAVDLPVDVEAWVRVQSEGAYALELSRIMLRKFISRIHW